MNKLRLQQKRQLINLIRKYFTDRGFFELETPLLVPSPGMEVHLHGFQTDYQDTTGRIVPYFLPTSPEFAIKKALGAGFEKVFEIARVFRNQGESGLQHHPEFNMLEWYQPGNYLDIMQDVEALLDFLSKYFESIPNRESDYWVKSVKRTSIHDCFVEHARMDLTAGMANPKQWRLQAKAVLQEHIPEDDTFEDIFFRVWLKMVEPQLGQARPEIVYDYPAEMAALAKLKDDDQRWAERFELYIRGVEIGNAFSELTDPEELTRRFEAANQERAKFGFPPHPIDHDLIESVGQMQATGGIAVGVERLLMALTGESNIRQFFLYPVGDAIRK